MIPILTFHDLTRLEETDLSDSVIRFTKALYECLYAAYNADDLPPEEFSLRTSGALYVVERGDELGSLAGSSPFGFEYVERIALSDTSVYRIGVLLDNDVLEQYLVPTGALNAESIAWLNGQSDVGGDAT